MKRILVWFSCGAASACTLKLARLKYPNLQACYCDTSVNEHPDNIRFLGDVEKWTGVTVTRLVSKEFPAMSIYDVFNKTKFLKGPAGAPCTKYLKRYVRESFQRPDDLHLFGYTLEESKRIEIFELNNPLLNCEWLLHDAGITKPGCLRMIKDASIAMPVMYCLGYKNNNCLGCVKGAKGYWNKIRRDFPEVFNKMARKERQLGFSLRDVYLDELPPDAGRYESEPDISCGPQCQLDSRL